MTSPTTRFFMAIFFLGSLATVLLNGFMAAALGQEWARGRKIPTGDLIVACLAVSRVSLHSMSIVNSLPIILNSLYKMHYLGILWDFSNMLTFWLNALLSVFYCMKIASFSHPAFFWLRWRLLHSIPRLLLGSLAISVLTTISSVISHTTGIEISAFYTPYINGSWPDPAWMTYGNILQFQQMLFLSVPFLLFLVSTVLLMISLYRHLHQMRGHQSGPHDPSTQAHTMALKLLGFFLVFYSSYFLSLLMEKAMNNILQCHWYWVWQVVTYTGISLHSTILLLSKPRLRKALKDRMHCCTAIGCGGLHRGQALPAGSGQEPVKE